MLDDDDELKKEFESFYSVVITAMPTTDKNKWFQETLEDAIWPETKELRKFTRTDFYKELINRKDND